VALVDVRPFSAAGARWVNGVPAWQLDRAGVGRPEGAEYRGVAVPVLMPPDGNDRLTLGELPEVLKLDMRLLVERLQRQAMEAGVTPFPRMQVREVVLDGERPVAVRGVQWPVEGARFCNVGAGFSPPPARAGVNPARAGVNPARAGVNPAPTEETPRSRVVPSHSGREERQVELRASLFVDASGLGGVLRRQVPALQRHTPDPTPDDVCVAAQQVREIGDPAGAEEYLARIGGEEGQNFTYLGVAGGFSTLMVSVEDGEVEILAGSLANGRAPSGGELIRRFRAENPWIGARVFGGQGRIPLRRPYDRLSAPGIALVGNAACQVFPAHGSGIGVGLVAGRILAEAVGERDDPGSLQATWDYQARAMRELGGLLGAYDIFRRLSQRLSGEQVGRLITTGLMSPGNARAGLLQHMPRPTPAEGLRLMSGAARAPGLASRMIPPLARMQALGVMYRRYPRRPCLRGLRRWSGLASRLHGGVPDVRSV
jgi:flavin-dependent dehydrogenase